MDELRQMNQKIRKLMTMNKDLHPSNDVDKLHVPRKEGLIVWLFIGTSVFLGYSMPNPSFQKNSSGTI